MRPLGIKPIRFPGKTDDFPSKNGKCQMWWAVASSIPNKKAARRTAKKRIMNTLRSEYVL